MSRNAVPIPRISLSVDEFIDIPFTQGLLQGKGHFSHGWLNDDRYAQNALIHDKSAKLQTGIINNTKIYFGLVHIALWGGRNRKRR